MRSTIRDLSAIELEQVGGGTGHSKPPILVGKPQSPFIPVPPIPEPPIPIVPLNPVLSFTGSPSATLTV